MEHEGLQDPESPAARMGAFGSAASPPSAGFPYTQKELLKLARRYDRLGGRGVGR